MRLTLFDNHAVSLNGQSPAAWFSLSLAQLAVGRHAESEVSMRRLLELDARSDYRRQRAYVAFGLGKDAATARDAQTFLERAGWGDESAPYVAFLAALAYRRLGQGPDADAVLEQVRPFVERGSWTEKVLDYMQRRLTADELLARATDNGQKTEAHTYIGFHVEMAGRREDAITHFRWVKDQGARNYVEYPMAVAELKRLERGAGPARQ